MSAIGIGDWVHFVNGDQHIPALVTQPALRVPDPIGGVDMEGEALTVFPVNDAPFSVITSQDETGTPGTWHRPEPTIDEATHPPDATNVQQIAFWFPYPIDPMEEEAVRDMMTLIVVMLKNGANAFELQQRLMGLT